MRCSEALKPAGSEVFRNELTACLALVAPAGMSEEARRDWLAVAWGTLKDLPADVLQIGCAEARRVCDHPAKIVPTIIQATNDWMRSRKEAARAIIEPVGVLPKKPILDRRGERMTSAETDELNAALERLGATARYRPDGSRYFTSPEAEERARDIETFGTNSAHWPSAA